MQYVSKSLQAMRLFCRHKATTTLLAPRDEFSFANYRRMTPSSADDSADDSFLGGQSSAEDSVLGNPRNVASSSANMASQSDLEGKMSFNPLSGSVSCFAVFGNMCGP